MIEGSMFELSNIIENIRTGELWMAFILAVLPLIYFYLKKEFIKNPRLKYWPLLYSAAIFLILTGNAIGILSIKLTWIGVAVFTLLFVYIYLTNVYFRISHEYLLVKWFERILSNRDFDDYTHFYRQHEKYFIFQTGKFKYGMMCLQFMHKYGVFPLCFIIMDDIEKLNLTKEEERLYFLRQFNIYCTTEALRVWENKYDTVKHVFKDDDKLYIESIQAYHKLDLKTSEELNQKLRAATTNKSYQQIAENNLAVIAENRSEEIEWNDQIQKSFTKSLQIQSNVETTTLNLISNYLHSGEISKAENEYRNYVSSLPSRTINQRLNKANFKLIYYRQTGDNENIGKVIESIFEEYKNASESKRIPILIHLLRISFSHNILFEQLLTEVESELDIILGREFATVRLITREILGIIKSTYGLHNQKRLFPMIIKCLKKIDTFDVSKEIGNLRNEDVVTKRDYIKFQSEISLINLTPIDLELFKKQLSTKFNILDQLIIFDKRQAIAMNLLDSLFLKLDEVVWAMGVIKEDYKITTRSEDNLCLHENAFKLISEILPIMTKADGAIMMAQYHLRLAHYYCYMNEDIKGYNHFLKFKRRGVNIMNYANWLQQWYMQLENYFSKPQ